MVRRAFTVVIAAVALCGFYISVPDVIAPFVLVPSQSAMPPIVPDFQDKKIWMPAKEHIFINFEDGIPWGMEYFYVRIDNALVMGMELVPVWDLDTPIYKVWGAADAPRQSLFRHGSGWTAPMNGAKIESIPRIDWSGHRAIGVTLMVYEGNAVRPSAWEVFVDPAVEADVLSPVVKREL